jgi:hypothetical protein
MKRGKADRDDLVGKMFAHKLADIPLAQATHVRGPGIANMRVVGPHHYFGRFPLFGHVFDKRIHGFKHVPISKVPRGDATKEHGPVVLFRILDEAGVLLGEEKLFFRRAPIALKVLSLAQPQLRSTRAPPLRDFPISMAAATVVLHIFAKPLGSRHSDDALV